MRISNFFLWQIAYTEIYVTETLWPDFREREFLEALALLPATRSAASAAPARRSSARRALRAVSGRVRLRRTQTAATAPSRSRRSG